MAKQIQLRFGGWQFCGNKTALFKELNAIRKDLEMYAKKNNWQTGKLGDNTAEIFKGLLQYHINAKEKLSRPIEKVIIRENDAKTGWEIAMTYVGGEIEPLTLSKTSKYDFSSVEVLVEKEIEKVSPPTKSPELPTMTASEMDGLIDKYIRWGKTYLTTQEICDYILEKERVDYESNIHLSVNGFGRRLVANGFHKVNINVKGEDYPEKKYAVELRDYHKFPATNNLGGNDFVMTMGKYSGFRVSEIDDYGYLAWVLNTWKLNPTQADIIENRIISLRPNKPTDPEFSI